MQHEPDEKISPKPSVAFKDGRLWFSGKVERRIYFIMTLIILIIGIAYRLEWLS